MTSEFGWIQTYSGLRFDVLNDGPLDQIQIGDIAHALSNICRFNGHTRAFYSVAQHCVEVARRCQPSHAFHGLMHDAAEAYVGDRVRPLKTELDKAIEQAVWYRIAARFDLSPVIPQSVHVIDTRMLATERRDLMCDRLKLEWTSLNGVLPFDEPIIPMPSHKARDAFLTVFLAHYTAGAK